ncbi:hypothetical protein FRC06_009410 [Ceratobasidium sp. 370]|nr:hypothetical protein FRC06_009410 [Ceratobasidium sp. 370]
MAKHYWGYFFPREELVDVFLDAGGTFGKLRRDSMTVTHLARQSIFDYLRPGHIRVYFDAAKINDDVVTGVSFLIGPDNAEFEDIPKDLLQRCRDMFADDPDKFVRHTANPEWANARVFEWWQDGEMKGLVQNLHFMEYVFLFCSDSAAVSVIRIDEAL